MTDEKLFSGVSYYLSRSLRTSQRNQLSQVLDLNGATSVDAKDDKLTHYVTNSLPGAGESDSPPAGTTAQLVTPLWVERTLVLSASLDPVHYSPDPAMLFSGVVATSCDLSASDNEVLSAGITSLGGQWRSALTKDVTHLFALAEGSHKYETAMHFKKVTGMKIVVPHWFDDVVRLGVRSLPTDEYEWPDVKLFKAFGVDGLKAEESRLVRRSKPLTVEKKALYDTALVDGSDLPSQVGAEGGLVWKDTKIVLGASLELNESQRSAHKADIARRGGVMLEFETPDEELERIEEADVYVTRYRSGPAFVKAYRLNKTIGTLAWLWYVRATGTLTRPTDQLLHYPVPKKQVDGFSHHIITVTNYTGKDREYIKKLITAMGAEFTASMSGKNTAVVAAYLSGTKTTKASSWGIPVVNHLWLEDCYSQWRNLPSAQEKYVVFSPGVDFGAFLTEDRGLGIGRVGYDQAELDVMEREVEEEEGGVASGSQAQSQPKKSILKRSEFGAYASLSSVRSAEEVENAVALGEDGDGDVSMVGDVGAGAYQDMDVPLDEDGRLSMAGSDLDLEHEAEMQVDQDDEPSADRKRVPGTPAKVKPSTPARGRRSTPARKPVTPLPSKPSSKAKVRSKAPITLESDDEADDQPEDSPVQPKKRLIRRVSGPAAPAEVPATPKTGKAARRSSAKENVHDAAGEPSEGDLGASAKKGSVIKTYRNRSRSRSQSKPRATRKSDDEGSPKPKPLPRVYGKASKGKGKATHVDEDTDMEDPEVIVPNSSKKAGPATRRKPAIPSESEEEEPRGRPRRMLTRRASRTSIATGAEEDDVVKLTRTPRREVSVLVPTLAEVRSASAKRAGRESKPSDATREKGKGGDDDRSKEHNERNNVARMESLVLQAQDASAKVPAKRGRPARISRPVEEPVQVQLSESEASASPSPMRPPKARPKRGAAPSTPEPGPSRVTPPEVPASLTRTPSKRSAAFKATQKLHDEVMPDLVNFQKELKNGNVKSALDVEQASVKKGKKRASLADEEPEDEEEPEKKRRRTSLGTKKGGKKPEPAQQSDSEDASAQVAQTAKGKKPESKVGAAKKSSSPEKASNVVVMTTQVALSDDTIKAFTKLGGKFTTKPSECTHLVARSIVRTEKFLCAMAVASHIVTDRWVETCVHKKMILPTDVFSLKDPENEKKYGFKLTEALSRAQAHKGKLFAGKTFYVTPKVPVEAKLLKNVVVAGGGQLLTQTPTVRILKGSSNRVVISSPADIAIWRPLAESGFAIYSQELILTGMLKQQLDWDAPSNKVEGSA